jgi:hypothetical protein
MATNDFGPIVGSWKMVEAWNINSPGQPKTYPWGNPPLGYWVYDSAGNVSVQISINPPLPLIDVTDPSWWTLGPIVQQGMLDSFNNYMAYFGTYTVDYVSNTVTHNVTTDVLRAYTGTVQPRPFQLTGNELIIGDQQTYSRRFIRVA